MFSIFEWKSLSSLVSLISLLSLLFYVFLRKLEKSLSTYRTARSRSVLLRNKLDFVFLPVVAVDIAALDVCVDCGEVAIRR